MQKLFLPILGAALSCLPHAARADLYFGFGTEKEFIQSSAKGPEFDGGRFIVILRDGIAVVAPCAYNGESSLHLPSLACPLGTTGIISSGFIFLDSDLGGDDQGQQVDNTYWSLSAAVPAQVIEPFRPELCRLIAAPASQLQRPLDGFTELGAIVFYNLLGEFTREYDIARYQLELPYGSLVDDNAVEATEGSRMFKELVPGQYVFSFPALTRPDLPRNFVVRINPFLEAYNTSDSGGKQGFKFLGNRWDSSGYYQIDPRLVHTFQWQGIKGKLVGTDKLYFSLAGDSVDENLEDDINPDYFPPNASRINIRNIQSTTFSMPPGFFEIGDTGIAKLEYERSLGTSAAQDRSTRAFKTRVRFVDTYPGFAAFGGMFQGSATTAKTRAATADYDKDGLNNVTEFAMQSNPADAAITSITSTPTTFTVTALNHRATVGDTIEISGATPPAYNGTWTVATATTDVLTITSAINAGTGKGGLVRLTADVPIAITAITPEVDPNLDPNFIPTYFTITAPGHGRKVGDVILVQGSDVAAYNGRWIVGSVTANTIRIDQEGMLLPATMGTVRLFVAGQLTVFDSEVNMPTYIRAHAGAVINIAIAKRPNVGTSISYGIETKVDAAAKKWAKVKTGSTWTVTFEDEEFIVFTSDGSVPLTTWIRPTATSNF